MNLSPTAVRDLDKYKRNYQTLLGIALTEAGALYAPKLRITLPYIARFALVGTSRFRRSPFPTTDPHLFCSSHAMFCF